MKSVVVEIKDSHVAVLSDDGVVSVIKNNNYKIGQVIVLKKQRKNNIMKITLAAASVATLLMVGGAGAWAYYSPYTYVSVDVNPSVEFTVNRFDRVIDVTAVNDDGEDILEQIQNEDLVNQTIEDAVKQTVNQIAEEGYFDATAQEVQSGEQNGETTVDPTESANPTSENEGNLVEETNTDTPAEPSVNDEQATEVTGGIVIVTSGEDESKAEDLANSLEQTVVEEVKQIEEADDSIVKIVVEVESVGYTRVQEARKLGITPGKLNLIQKMKASSTNPESINIEEWKDKSVKEIMSVTKANKAASKVVSGDDAENDLEDKAKDAAEIAEEEAKEAAERAEEEAKEAAEKAEEEAKEAEEEVEEAEEEAKEAAEEADKVKDADKESKERAKEIAEQAKEQAKEAAERAKEAEKSAREQAKEAEKRASEQAKEVEEKAKEQAKEAVKQQKEQAKDAAEKAKEQAKADEKAKGRNN